MLRYFFSAIIFLHGLIHLMGFTKAFQLAEINALSSNISKPAGLLWLASCLLFIFTGICFLAGNQWWWQPAAIACVLSQVLVIACWQDAKAGTAANAIVFIVALIAWANGNFNRTVHKEISQIIQQEDLSQIQREIVTKEMFQHLPAPVRSWLSNSGIVGKEKIHTVHLKQNGWIRTAPDKDNWKEAVAEQYFTIDKPAFIWQVKMEMMPLVSVSGRDRYVNGKGQMQIKAYSLINMVKAENEKVDQGTLQRYLSEICWFPSAAMSPYIHWETVDDTTAKATMTYEGVKGSVTFFFSTEGDITKCIADRYMGSSKEAKLEKWVVKSTGYDTMNGVRMPIHSEVTWKLPEGDFTWFKLEITGIEYNSRVRPVKIGNKDIVKDIHH